MAIYLFNIDAYQTESLSNMHCCNTCTIDSSGYCMLQDGNTRTSDVAHVQTVDTSNKANQLRTKFDNLKQKLV